MHRFSVLLLELFFQNCIWCLPSSNNPFPLSKGNGQRHWPSMSFPFSRIKISSWARWVVIPATWEAEARGLRERGRRRFNRGWWWVLNRYLLHLWKCGIWMKVEWWAQGYRARKQQTGIYLVLYVLKLSFSLFTSPRLLNMHCEMNTFGNLVELIYGPVLKIIIWRA